MSYEILEFFVVIHSLCTEYLYYVLRMMISIGIIRMIPGTWYEIPVTVYTRTSDLRQELDPHRLPSSDTSLWYLR